MDRQNWKLIRKCFGYVTNWYLKIKACVIFRRQHTITDRNKKPPRHSPARLSGGSRENLMVISNNKTVNSNNLVKSGSTDRGYRPLKVSAEFSLSRQQNTQPISSNSSISLCHPYVNKSPATFMKRFQEDIVRANISKAKKLAKRKNRDLPITPEAEHFIENAKFNRELIVERLQNGYERRGYKQLSGHQVAPVRESGLRSETLNSAAAKLFVAAVPKAKDLRSNWGKGALDKLGVKLFSLDEPYIEGNRKFLSFIRIDTDRVWDSYEQCQDFFRQLAADGKIACEPHFLVGLRLRNGQYVRPHAIWMLPYGSAVWNEPSKEGFNRSPVDLFYSVYYGLNNALLEAGADAGAPATSQQVKNPLSPEWFTICPQDSNFPDLSEHAEYLELGYNRDTLSRQAAAVQSGMDFSQSNGLFNFLQKAAYSIMHGWHFAADPEFKRHREEGRLGAISDRLHIELERAVAQSDIRPSKKDGNLAYLIATVANYAAGKFNPEKLSSKKDRGAALHVVKGLRQQSDRQAAGGRFAAIRNSDRVLKKITDAVQKLKAQGIELTKSTVAKIAEVARGTVHKYWDQVMAQIECSKQCMIKRYSPFEMDQKRKNGTAQVVNPSVAVSNMNRQVVDRLGKRGSDTSCSVHRQSVHRGYWSDIIGKGGLVCIDVGYSDLNGLEMPLRDELGNSYGN